MKGRRKSMFTRSVHSPRVEYLCGLALLVGVFATLVLSSGSEPDRSKSRTTAEIGPERLVAWEPLPEFGGTICEIMPASASEEAMFALTLPPSAPAATHPA